MIKKATLTFASKFWWLLVHYRQCLTIVDNVLTQDGASLIASMMAGYNIDFVAII